MKSKHLYLWQNQQSTVTYDGVYRENVTLFNYKIALITLLSRSQRFDEQTVNWSSQIVDSLLIIIYDVVSGSEIMPFILSQAVNSMHIKYE